MPIDVVPFKAREMVHEIIGTIPAAQPLTVIAVKERLKTFLGRMGAGIWYDKAYSENGWDALISSCIRIEEET